jgi:hypothetical protein
MAARIAERAGQSLPKQCGDWAELKAAYRLLSNPHVEPTAISRPHRDLTAITCGEHRLVLAVQDDTHVAGRCQRECHSTLAVLPDGRLVGLLDQRFFARVDKPKQETHLEREARWRESLVWAEAVENIGPLPCRLIHVADRAADNLEFIEACRAAGVGFIVRARHDRRVEEGTHKLWGFLAEQPISARPEVRAGEQRDAEGKIVCRHRQAQVELRFAAVQLEPPYNHPGQHRPQQVTAIYLREPNPPPGMEPIDWLLLSSEPAQSVQDALRIVSHYERRWVIEEWHKALKEGCALQASQLDQPEDHLRLASILSVVAVRLLQLRDLADPEHPEADSPEALQRSTPSLWIQIVAQHAGLLPSELTPRLFLLTIAKQGGYLARRSDPRPGWKVIWRGWYDFSLIVQGADLALSQPTSLRSG